MLLRILLIRFCGERAEDLIAAVLPGVLRDELLGEFLVRFGF